MKWLLVKLMWLLLWPVAKVLTHVTEEGADTGINWDEELELYDPKDYH